MPGGGNQMNQLMKQAQKMQEDLAVAQEEVAGMKAEATSGGGVVRVILERVIRLSFWRSVPGSWIPRTWRCSRT